MWSDTASGSPTERPELAQLFDHLRPGDTLVVWRLDRVGRSVWHLTDVVGELGERSVGLRSLQEGIDTTTPGSTPRRLAVALFSPSFRRSREFERKVIVERSWVALAAGSKRERERETGVDRLSRPLANW